MKVNFRNPNEILKIPYYNFKTLPTLPTEEEIRTREIVIKFKIPKWFIKRRK